MKTHVLKTDPVPFADVVEGKKLVEIRKNDRGFEVGDILHLQETSYSSEEMAAGQPLEYTADEVAVAVLHIITGYGLKDGYCAMSILPL